MKPAPDSVQQLLAYAADTAADLEKTIRADLETKLNGADPLLVEVLHYGLLGGGKRIRPLLAILCSRLCGRNDDALWQLAAALEYLHVATLIHDDVIDHADLRRGRSSVVARYGLPAAILAGDWLHARSMHLIGVLTGSEGLDLFSAATMAMVDGEFLQLRGIADPETTEDHYFAVIHRKTAGLIRCTCALAALFAGAEPGRQSALAGYGWAIGTAFQVVDDLLDYQGDSATGKLVGNDLVEGKITLPLLRALQSAAPAIREELIDLLSGDRAAPATQNRVRLLIEELDGFAAARREAERLIAEACHQLTVFPPGPESELLTALAGYILSRNK